MKRPIKPKPSSKHKAMCDDLYTRLQRSGIVRTRALAELQNRFRAADEHAVVRAILKRTSTTIQTHQLNADRPEYVYQINMQYEDRTKPPIYGYYYPPVYVIKSWNSMNDGVILSYLVICKQIGRFI